VFRIGILSGTGTGRKRTIPALLGSTAARVTVVHGRTAGTLAAVLELDPAIRTTPAARCSTT
jgi:hypothetical protein